MISVPHLPRICVTITNHGDKTGCILGITRHPNIKVVMTTCAQQFLRMQTGNILQTFLHVCDYERCPSENILPELEWWMWRDRAQGITESAPDLIRFPLSLSFTGVSNY